MYRLQQPHLPYLTNNVPQFGIPKHTFVIEVNNLDWGDISSNDFMTLLEKMKKDGKPDTIVKIKIEKNPN